jgi:hypothetical protein
MSPLPQHAAQHPVLHVPGIAALRLLCGGSDAQGFHLLTRSVHDAALFELCPD